MATLSPAEALDHLLDILHARNIHLGRDDIGWAFTSPKTSAEVTEYVKRYINEGNLLTLEESQTYEKLKSQLPHKEALSSSLLPKNEEEIQREIDALEASTALLKKQTAVLTEQNELLGEIEAEEREKEETKTRDDDERKRRYTGEREQLSAAVEDILAEIGGLSMNRAQGKSLASLKVGECLKSDDRLLDRTQKLLSSSVAPNAAADKEVFARVEKLSSSLTALKTAIIRTKLDRIYLEESHSKKTIGDGEVEAIMQDLNSLHNDIETVSGMVTNEVYYQPIKQKLEETRQARVRDLTVRYEYIINTLSQLSERNVLMADYLTKDAFRSQLTAEMLKRIEQTSAVAPELKRTNASPVKRSVGMATPKRTTQATPQTPSQVSEVKSSTEILLRRVLGLPLTQSMPEEILEFVDQRLNKISHQEASHELDTIAKIESILNQLGGMVFILEDALWADTKWAGGTFKLQDEGLETELQEIEAQVKRVAKEYAGLVESARTRDGREQEKFIKKWAAADRA